MPDSTLPDSASDVSAADTSSSCCVRAVGFDFASKVERELPLEQIAEAMQTGVYVWLDVDFTQAAAARDLLLKLKLIDEQLMESVLGDDPGTQHARYPNCLHITLSGCAIGPIGFGLQRVDAVVSRQFMLTLHRGSVEFLSQMKRESSDDFRLHAKTPSFLVFELWAHLLENYVVVQRRLEKQVEQLQTELLRSVDDQVFRRVGDMGAVLLHFRSVLLPAREVLSDLSTRRSDFISEATQPFLANMVGTVERVLQDLLADREVLSETLNLHMSMVAHRTNEVVKRLTIVSVVFMPLTFLCGIWGMNFEYMPETKWKFGYLLFWGLAAIITTCVLTFVKRKKWL